MTCGVFMYNNGKNALNDDDEPPSSLSFCTTEEKKKPKDNDELGGSLLFSRTKEKNQEMTMNLPSWLVVFFCNPKKTNTR